MDQAKIDALAERIVSDVNGAMSCLNVYVGHRLGLFQALADAGPVTPPELATKTGDQGRYLREWLECMAVGDFLSHDDATGAFSVSREHAVALLDRDSPAYATPFVCYIPSFAKVLDRLLEAFRSGGGVPYEDYGADTLEGIGS